MAIARIALLVFALLAPTSGFAQALPNPVLEFIGAAPFEANGKEFVRYSYAVANRSTYPDTLFAPAPELPPCGTNTSSARSWVDVYGQNGKRLSGFCALGSSDALGELWFALAADELPPSWIYIEITDRKTGFKYKSNLAETTF